MSNAGLAVGLGPLGLGYGVPFIVAGAACALSRVRFVREHRWQVIALFAIPVLASWVFELSWYWFVNNTEDRGAIYGHLYLAAAFIAVAFAATYPLVRRFAPTAEPAHAFLRLYWQFRIVDAFIGLCMVPVWQFVDDAWLTVWSYEMSVSHPETAVTATGLLFGFSVPWLLGVAALLWFIWRAARISPGHAWLLLALSLATSYISIWGKMQIIPDTGWEAVSMYAVLVFHIVLPFILNGMMLGAFTRYQSAPSVPAVAIVIPAALLLATADRWTFDAMFLWPIAADIIHGTGVALWPADAFVRLAGNFIDLLPVLTLAWLAILWTARRHRGLEG